MASAPDNDDARGSGRSLRPELLSGRSLEPSRPPRRRDRLRGQRRALVVVLAVVLVAGGAVAAKLVAESAADAAMSDRAGEVADMLEGATPEDFLAFDAAVRDPGSLARRIRDTDGFVNVRARAEWAFIRIQPSGWWAGFTERCVVAVVRPDGVTVETPKTSCVRVPAPES